MQAGGLLPSINVTALLSTDLEPYTVYTPIFIIGQSGQTSLSVDNIALAKSFVNSCLQFYGS